MVSESLSELPLVVIVGPTASGKTSLAIDLAEQYGGEIICADSRTVYTGMDIGTAKPTHDERSRVPHWGLDLVEPGERFTAANFQSYANERIEDIRSRGHVPFLVGGTGLYIDAVLFNYQFGLPANQTRRNILMSKGIDELINYCRKNDISLPKNDRNKRHVIRAIEQLGQNQKRENKPRPNSIIVGITTNSDTLYTRIEQRNEQLFQNGVVEEARMLGKKYGWNSEAMTGNIYRSIGHYLKSERSLEALEAACNTNDRQLAKRQLTWFRRNPFIMWHSLEEARIYISKRLAGHIKA